MEGTAKHQVAAGPNVTQSRPVTIGLRWRADYAPRVTESVGVGVVLNRVCLFARRIKRRRSTGRGDLRTSDRLARDEAPFRQCPVSAAAYTHFTGPDVGFTASIIMQSITKKSCQLSPFKSTAVN